MAVQAPVAGATRVAITHRAGVAPRAAAGPAAQRVQSHATGSDARSSAGWAEALVGGALALQALPLARGRRGRLMRLRAGKVQRAATATSVVETSTKLEWPADRVRKSFVDFFVEKKAHNFVASSPVVPLNDPTLLFANSGMCQFKPIFMGQLDPSSPLQGVARAANSQKCIRAGGKHNDLDDVGRDVYHHTFFEMLGNWSFGDYFKKEAIDWAWELLTEVYKLEPERLYASYFRGDEELGLPCDDEAREFWLRHLPPERVLPYGKKENFWEMGATGPCGPCSELHYDRIGGRDASQLVNADDPDVIEIWNLVFMQFYREDSGKLSKLPNQHVDTGMGLERITSILQNKRSNYDTDVFGALLESIHKQVGGEPYQGKIGAADPELRDTAYRIIADHARTLTLAVADGAVPSSEGRGYVLRRILRRAVRYGRQMLKAPPGFFSDLVPVVAKCLGPAYPELAASAAKVQAVLKEEEVAFDRTVERGMQYFSELKAEMATSGTKVVPGERAFLLYDSHGFPLDLTQQMAEEAGLTVDFKGFEDAMERQKERSRDALREQQALEMGMKPLELVAEQTAWLEKQSISITEDGQKYIWDTTTPATVKAIFTEQGFLQSTEELKPSEGGSRPSVGIVLDKTSFYAEAGGQVGDVGELSSSSGSLLDVKKVQVFGGFILHSGLLAEGASLKVGQEVQCKVDYATRRKVAPNHTMTHVLNWALREVLGDGVDQRGSMVTADRLRFDFSVDTVTLPQLTKVEQLVQSVVEAKIPVTVAEASLAAAKAVNGLRAVAGESYPDPVRVVTVGPSPISELLANPSEPKWRSQSVEFCGGTHLSNSSEAGSFAILEERAIAKGVRRIVGATGAVAQEARQAGVEAEKKLTLLESAKAAPAEEELVAFGKLLDETLLPAPLKAKCRERLDELRKKLKKQQMKGAKAEVAATKERLSQAVAAAKAAGAKHTVVTLENTDSKVLQQALPGLTDVALLVIVKTADGLQVAASVPELRQAGGQAADAWVRETVVALGGKGGGKADRAQGTAPAGADAAAAEAAANKYWA